ncbi:MAG: NusG domain II-containing protein [Treponema sp.]|nr:NusG domain II-containing protein [Treponema sp.]
MSSVFINFFKKIKLLDFVIFVIFVAVTAVAFATARKISSARVELIVHTPHGVYAYDMSNDKIIEVNGALGISRIEIVSGTARFIDSPCPNKTCVYAYPIGEAGAWAACLPNQIFIRIEGSNAGAADVMAQ